MATAFEEVMGIRNKGMPATDEVQIAGADPVFSTKFKIGETCAAVLAGIGTAVSDIWEIRTSRRQNIAIDVRHAAAALRSTGYMPQPTSNGAFEPIPLDAHNDLRRITQPRQTNDGRW